MKAEYHCSDNEMVETHINELSTRRVLSVVSSDHASIFGVKLNFTCSFFFPP